MRSIGSGELQRGRIPRLQEGSRSEGGQVAAEADKGQQLGLRAIPEPVLRGIVPCHKERKRKRKRENVVKRGGWGVLSKQSLVARAWIWRSTGEVQLHA